MDLWHAIVLGVIEGITEFLPISSTGHLILAGRMMGLEQTEFLKTFDVAIQLGAILAVVFLYGRPLLVKVEVLKRVFAAFIPTAITGAVFYKFIKGILMNSEQVILWALFLGGIFLIVFDLMHKEKENGLEDISAMSYPTAVAIGLFQALAMIPGVSRAAATIIGGLVLGLKRRTIVEFSFLLAVPTMAAATALAMMRTSHAFSTEQFVLLGAGFVTSFAVAILAIKFLIHFIKNHNFVSFGIYRIILACLFWALGGQQ